MRWSNSSEGRSGGGGLRRSPLPRRAFTRTVEARLTPLRTRSGLLLMAGLLVLHAPLLLLLHGEGRAARCCCCSRQARPPAANAILLV